MNITSENALDILNAIIDISPEFGKIVDMAVKQAETKTLQNELLQQDQNLADDQAKIEKDIKSYDCNITAIRAKLNAFIAARLNLYKQLKEIKRKRDDIHRTWVEKFACQP